MECGYKFTNTNGKQFLFSDQVFPKVLELAKAYRWIPRGTNYIQRTEDEDGFESRQSFPDGSYLATDGARVSDEDTKELVTSLEDALKEVPNKNLFRYLGDTFNYYNSGPVYINYEVKSESMDYDLSPVDLFYISFSKSKDYTLDMLRGFLTFRGNISEDQVCQLLIWFSNDLLKDKLIKFIDYCKGGSFTIRCEGSEEYEEWKY